MSVKKILARGWTLEVSDGETVPSMIEVKGLTSLSFAFAKEDADITDFDSDGQEEHIPVQRGSSVSVEGYRLEVPTYNDKPAGFLEILTPVGALAGGNITVTLTPSGGAAEDFVVTLADDDDIEAVATKIATDIDADLDWDAIAKGSLVIITHDTEIAFDMSFADTETTGVTVDGKISGERDPGQLRVEVLGKIKGNDGIEEFDLTSPGGTTKNFFGSVVVNSTGGGLNDPTGWSVEIKKTA